MHLPSSLVSLALLLLAEPARSQTTPNPKRGLVYVPNERWPQDNSIWTEPSTSLTWYYNYKSTPSAQFSSLAQSDFEFVPMMWGAPADLTDTTFLTEVEALIDEKRVNISHVMGFNEPDGPGHQGGSNIAPATAAQVWVRNIIPLQQQRGIKVGLPAPTGGWGGVPWLRQFLGNCSDIISAANASSASAPKQNCTFDFVPIHWYGPFGGLASHIGTYRAAFPDKPVWVTEWNFNDQSLSETQEFVRMSLEYMDRIPDVERYSLFASFRSSVSNVGPNAAMLSNGGQLTDIGAMYLGRDVQGVAPTSGGSTNRRSVGRVALTLFLASIIGFVCFGMAFY